jgi:hypothetical protein
MSPTITTDLWYVKITVYLFNIATVKRAHIQELVMPVPSILVKSTSVNWLFTNLFTNSDKVIMPGKTSHSGVILQNPVRSVFTSTGHFNSQGSAKEKMCFDPEH